MEWIAIKDRLPEIDQQVLFCAFLYEGFTDVEIGWYEGGKTDSDLGDIAIETAWGWFPCTHWMPVPDKPKAT